MKRRPEKSEILYQLINREKNRRMLEDIPNISYLDMSIVFYYWKDARRDCACLINNQEMTQWGFTTQELEQAAAYNTPRAMPVDFRSMEEVIAELFGEEEFDNDDDSEEIPMHILTNKDKFFGAAAILYPQVLWAVSHTLQDDLYILPSSIHECIIVPASVECTRKELEIIVRDINQSQVPEEEVLSNHVYVYRKDEDILAL